jgi:Trk K+ transport system NAD-binding subunit
VIVLDSDQNGDAAVVSAVLAARSVAPGMTAPIVAEVDDAATAAALRAVTDGQVRPVRSQDVIAQVTAQATRQPGLGAVTLDLLNFEGDEIYFTTVPELHGKTYGEALLSFPEASVIGIAGPDGAVVVNPPQAHVIASGSAVVAIAADDDRVRYRAATNAVAVRGPVREVARRGPERIMVVGWSRMGSAVLRALGPYLEPGSSVRILARDEFVDEDERFAPRMEGVEITYTPISADIEELERIVRGSAFDEVIVLGYRSEISVADADAHTILTMLHLSRLLGSAPGRGPRLVAEILDSRKAELAKMARVDDLVVSDSLAALMIAQLAENPRLSTVFDELFDADGAVVSLHPAERYAEPGKEATFMDLVAAAASAGQSAIGYRRASDGAVRLNPAKSERFVPAPGDGLVVVGPAVG